MAKENEEKSLREYGIRKKRLKRRRRIVIITLLLIIAFLGVVYFITIYNRNYNSYGVVKTTEITGENAVGYLSYGTSVVKYSKDGAVAIDKSGKQLWNGSYEMSEPIADTSGKYVVIADKDAKSIHIYDRAGEVGSITTPYDIIKVEVASQGVVAALMEEEAVNYITLYDVDGTELIKKKTSVNTEGYPLDFSLSEDGTKLVTSYLSYAGGSLVNQVSFYNFGEVGQNLTDNLVGGYKFDEGIIIPRVAFVNNDTVCAFKDDGFTVFSMKEKPSKRYKEDIEGQIQSILYNEKYTGVVTQAEGSSTKQIMIYDVKGKKVLDKAIDFDYETIYLSDEEVIMYDNTSCLILKMNGRVKFRYTFDSNIEAFCPINNLDRYYLANGSNLLEIQLED